MRARRAVQALYCVVCVLWFVVCGDSLYCIGVYRSCMVQALWSSTGVVCHCMVQVMQARYIALWLAVVRCVRVLCGGACVGSLCVCCLVVRDVGRCA